MNYILSFVAIAICLAAAGLTARNWDNLDGPLRAMSIFGTVLFFMGSLLLISSMEWG